MESAKSTVWSVMDERCCEHGRRKKDSQGNLIMWSLELSNYNSEWKMESRFFFLFERIVLLMCETEWLFLYLKYKNIFFSHLRYWEIYILHLHFHLGRRFCPKRRKFSNYDGTARKFMFPSFHICHNYLRRWNQMTELIWSNFTLWCPMWAALEKYKPRKLKWNYFHSKPGLL